MIIVVVASDADPVMPGTGAPMAVLRLDPEIKAAGLSGHSREISPGREGQPIGQAAM